MNRNSILVFGSLFLFLITISFRIEQHKPVEIRDDFTKYYERLNVEGSFLLYHQNTDALVGVNGKQFNQPFIPASTFKICNALIGLELGILKDEHHVFKWDSIKRQNPVWNKDMDLTEAFRTSCVWYFQELARKVGSKRYKKWLDKLPYGNADTSGGIDRFWLTGGLRISPEQQIDFLVKLNRNQLPFAFRNIDIVKNLMVMEQTPDYILRSKTGWGLQDSTEVGWYIGILEFREHIYYFVNCIQSKSNSNPDFAKARVEITRSIFTDLEITR